MTQIVSMESSWLSLNSTQTTLQPAEHDEQRQSIELEAGGSEEAPKPSPSTYLEGWRLYSVTAGLMLSCICSGLVR